MSTILRILVVLWVIDALNDVTYPDSDIRKLRKRIEYYRKWNERIGRHILKLETEYTELIS